MASFTNPWVAASRSILDTLAQRDVAQRLEAERQAEAARQAEEMELRRRQIASAEENTRSLIADREADQRLRAEEAARRRAEAERQRQIEAANQQDVAGLIEMYYTAQDPKDRAKIATQIQMRGGRVVEPESPALPRNLAEALMMGDERAVNAFKRAAQFEQGLRGGGARNTELSPSQVMSITRQAMQQAQFEVREGMLSPEDVQARAAELRYEMLADLGVEGTPPPSPTEIRALRALSGPATPAQPGPTGTRQDIHLGAGPPPVPAPPPQEVPPPQSLEEIPAWLEAQGASPSEANIRAVAERFNLLPAARPSASQAAPLTGRQR